jgi:hypothetical protein
MDVDQLERLTAEEMHLVQEIDDRVSKIQTTFLIEEAQRVMIQYPTSIQMKAALGRKPPRGRTTN